MQPHSTFKRSARAISGLMFFASIGLVACRGTQRLPGPLWLEENSSPDELADPGTSNTPVASVIRHSAPVWVRHPGASAGTQVAYYNKRVRVQQGASVRVGFGGRAELLWPDRASSVLLFNSGEASFGDRTKDEPLLTLSHLGRAQITLGAGDHVLLPGGAELRGDGSPSCGPIHVEGISTELMRFKNQSKQVCEIRYRGSEFKLLGGETLDLPHLLVSSFNGLDALLKRVSLGDRTLHVSEGLRADLEAGAFRVVADAEGRVAFEDIVVHLRLGERAVFSGLDRGDTGSRSNFNLQAQE